MSKRTIWLSLAAIASTLLWLGVTATKNDVVPDETRLVERATSMAPASSGTETGERKIIVHRSEAPHVAAEPGPVDELRPAEIPPWQGERSRRHRALLASSRFDVLVVPVQVTGRGIGRSARSYMSARLALALARAGAGAVPDTYLVARALGEGKRRYRPEAVLGLARSLDVRRVVQIFVWHTESRDLGVKIGVQDREVREDGSLGEGFMQPTYLAVVDPAMRRRGRAANLENPWPSDEPAHMDTFERFVPEILRALGASLSTGQPEPQLANEDVVGLPASLVTDDKNSPLQAAYRLQLLAALVPREAEHVRMQFYEKSLLAIRDVAERSGPHAVLEARAVLQMGYREPALALLGSPEHPAGRAFSAAANGNAEKAEAAARDIAGPLPRLLALVDAADIAGRYGSFEDDDAAAIYEGEGLDQVSWGAMLHRRLRQWDDWFVEGNLANKAELDTAFPLDAFGVGTILTGALILGDAEKARLDVDRSVAEHVGRAIEGLAGAGCCNVKASRPDAFDHLALLEARGWVNVVRHAYRHASMQGLPEKAIAYLEKRKAVYGGLSAFEYELARAELAAAVSADPTTRASLQESASRHLKAAIYEEQGKSALSAKAMDKLLEVPVGLRGRQWNYWVSEVPHHPDYPTWGTQSEEQKAYRMWAVLANSATNADVVRKVYRYVEGRSDEQGERRLMEALEHRFKGSPTRTWLIASRHVERGSIDLAMQEYRKGITSQPDLWMFYKELGTLLVETGDYDGAAALFQSYPGFAKPEEDGIGVSNRAAAAGALFYFSGEFERARPFFRLAAELRTGSGGSIHSAMRLALMDRDLQAAAMHALQNVRRYGDSSALRDYLGLLHALGYSKQAWETFDVAAPRQRLPWIWETTLVGHRLERRDDTQLVEWATQPHLRDATDGVFSFPALALVHATVTDRVPSEHVIAALEGIASPVWTVQRPHDSTLRWNREKQWYEVAGPPHAEEKAVLVKADVKPEAMRRIPSDLVYFARGYRALAVGEFDAAFQAFDEAARYYSWDKERNGYPLAYYAIAAARTGHADTVRAVLDDMPPIRRRFDWHLADAVLQAMAGEHEAANRALGMAIARRAYTDRRPIAPSYVFVETCEWLWEATANPRYRDHALTWARAVQVIRPMYAWPYVFEAKLEEDPKKRAAALRFAQFLDPDSPRLKSIPGQETGVRGVSKPLENPFLEAIEQQATGTSL